MDIHHQAFSINQNIDTNVQIYGLYFVLAVPQFVS